MPVKKKNLTKENVEDVSAYENKSCIESDKTFKSTLSKLQIKVKCLNEKQKQFKQSIEEKEITISIGTPGSGKTYMALMMALHLLKTEPVYKKIILVKSLQVIQGEEVGFLPGDVKEKMAPYMMSFTGNLDKIFSDSTTTKALMDQNIIQIQPIAYVRGVTHDNCIVILDEMENVTLHTYKSLITRIGKNCKMIFLGDVEQIDLRRKEDSCLQRVFERFKTVETVGTVEFTRDECVRNPIIGSLLDILDELE